MTTHQPQTRTVDAPYATVAVSLEDDLILGGKVIHLNPDTYRYPAKTTALDPAAARELARYLVELAELAEDEYETRLLRGEWACTRCGQPVSQIPLEDQPHSGEWMHDTVSDARACPRNPAEPVKARVDA